MSFQSLRRTFKHVNDIILVSLSKRNEGKESDAHGKYMWDKVEQPFSTKELMRVHPEAGRETLTRLFFLVLCDTTDIFDTLLNFICKVEKWRQCFTHGEHKGIDPMTTTGDNIVLSYILETDTFDLCNLLKTTFVYNFPFYSMSLHLL